MLSRLAESLYWLGRHTERADCTARMVDTYLPFQQRAGSSGDRVLRALVMGCTPDADLTEERAVPQELINTLVYDQTSPSSIAGSLTAARENARGVRDYLPPGIWQTLNVTWHGLRARTPTPSGPHSFLRWVGERCAVTSGLVDQVMSRDEGWQFLTAGRGLERADMTIRMLIADVPHLWTDAAARSAVNAIGGWHAFLRTQHRVDRTMPAQAFDFGLLDSQFPRSIMQSLRQAEQALAALDDLHLMLSRKMDSPRRIVAQARTALEYRTAPSSGDEIAFLLGALHSAVGRAHDAMRGNHFSTEDVSWAIINPDDGLTLSGTSTIDGEVPR